MSDKVIEEFQYLLEKSQQLFLGLRELPTILSAKQWQPYFQKTFEVYTKVKSDNLTSYGNSNKTTDKC